MVQIELTCPARAPASPVAISSSSSTLPHAPACRVSWYSTYTARTYHELHGARRCCREPSISTGSLESSNRPAWGRRSGDGRLRCVRGSWPAPPATHTLSYSYDLQFARPRRTLASGTGEQSSLVRPQHPECTHNLWAPRTPEDGISASALEAHGPRPQDA